MPPVRRATPSRRGYRRPRRLVYQVIGWGVLVLAALGLLVSQTIVVPPRMWFLGLARAMGASRAQIAFDVQAQLLRPSTLSTSSSRRCPDRERGIA